MKTCDICKDTTKELTTLRDEFDALDACDSCLKALEKRIFAMMAERAKETDTLRRGVFETFLKEKQK